MPFGDGEYLFKLPLPMIAELQRKTKTGIGSLFARVIKGRFQLIDGPSFGDPREAEYSIEDLIETIRCALIGGGTGTVDGANVLVTPPIAQSLMAAYVYPARPIAEAWAFAAAILSACIEGYEEPDPGKTGGTPEADEKTGEAQTDGSTGQSPLPT